MKLKSTNRVLMKSMQKHITLKRNRNWPHNYCLGMNPGNGWKRVNNISEVRGYRNSLTAVEIAGTQ